MVYNIYIRFDIQALSQSKVNILQFKRVNDYIIIKRSRKESFENPVLKTS